MGAYIFKGREYAQEIEDLLKKDASKLIEKGIKPKLVSIIVGNDPGSILYLNLKRNAGERVGVNVEVVNFLKEAKKEDIINLIKKLNTEPKVHGIMVQLPLPSDFSDDARLEIINSIDGGKDVDGLRDDSPYTAPVVIAVEDILNIAEGYIHPNNYPFITAVVGSNGFVGRKLMARLTGYNSSIFRIYGLDYGSSDFEGIVKSADIIISVTGKPDLIKADMVKEGVVLIDVGAPSGDIEKASYEKASFVSPVPGGVGPVTISCLIENLLSSMV